MRGAQSFGVVLKKSTDKRNSSVRHNETPKVVVNGDHGTKVVNSDSESSPRRLNTSTNLSKVYHNEQATTTSSNLEFNERDTNKSISVKTGVTRPSHSNNEVKKPSLFTDSPRDGTNKLVARNFLTHQLQRNRSIGAKVSLRPTAKRVENSINAGKTDTKSGVSSGNLQSDFSVCTDELNKETSDSIIGEAVIGEKTITTVSTTSEKITDAKPISITKHSSVKKETFKHISSRVNNTELPKNGVKIATNGTDAHKTAAQPPLSNYTNKSHENFSLNGEKKVTTNEVSERKSDKNSNSPSVINNNLSSRSISSGKDRKPVSTVTVSTATAATKTVEKRKTVVAESESNASDSSDSSLSVCSNNSALFSTLAKDSEPEFLEELKDVSLLEGATLSLTAKVKTGLDQTAQWLKDKVVIKSSPYIKISYKDGVSAISIRNAALANSGEYECEVKNKIGSATTTCNVIVEKKPTPPVFKKRLQATANIMEDKKAEFVVTVDGSPPPEVKWTYNNADLVETDRIHVLPPDEKQHKVVFDFCQMSDKGRIKCTIKNSAGSASCFCDISVKPGPPKIKLISEPEISTEAGQDVYLEIEGPSDGGRYKADWYKESKAIYRSTKKYDITAKDNRFSFVIKALQNTDEGTYKCVLAGPGGRTTQEFKISIQGMFSVIYFFYYFLLSYLTKLYSMK